MMKIDRLTTLMERFHLSIRLSDDGFANLLVLGSSLDSADHVIFLPRETKEVPDGCLLAAYVDWGQAENPFLASLPGRMVLEMRGNPETQAIVNVMCREAHENRCGAQSVVSRLGDVLFVRLLRAQIEKGSTQAGLLAGLSDPRLSRAIVAIHDQPERNWTSGDLATEAGLSLSRFSELFAQQVGETPMSYLRRWRLILARQDVLKGDRIDAIARRYAYKSSEGFSRAFQKTYGELPISLRPTRDRVA